MPARIQLRRTKGWRKPEGALNCARPGPLGNPFVHDDPAVAVQAFDDWLDGKDVAGRGLRYADDTSPTRRSDVIYRIWKAKGQDCACWCRLPAAGQPDICHAAVILRRANA